MALAYVGALPIGALSPLSFTAMAAMEAELSAELAANLSLQAALGVSVAPPTVALSVVLAAEIAAGLVGSASFGLPNFNLSFSANLSAQAVILEGLVASLQLLLGLAASAGIDVFTDANAVNALGGDVAAELATGAPSGGLPTDTCNAAVLLTRAPATFATGLGFFTGAYAGGAGITYCGSQSVGVLVSAVFSAALAAEQTAQSQLAAQIAMSLAASASFVPGTVVASVQLLASISASVGAALAVGMPSISAELTANVGAAVTAKGALSAQLTAVLALGLAVGAFDVWTYSGPVNGLGTALSNALAAGAPSGGLPTDASQSIVLLTRSNATWTALTTLLGGL